ncbi:MAG: hypothetical protein C0401_09680 [Anaerolinea sp.]|nr:hypothetical protein [Anaerolinea sp.]
MRTQSRPAGQSLIEFALIFPIAFFLILGFLDLGRAVYFYASLSTAVREGTRYAIVNGVALDNAYIDPQNNAIMDKVLAYAIGPKLIKENVVIAVTKDPNQLSGSSTDVKITANYCFKAITPFINQIIGKKCPLTQPGIPIIVQSKMHVAPVAR